MNFNSIEEIYEANDRIRQDLKDVVEGISEAAAARIPDGGTWSVAHIVEHLQLVEYGMSRICSKLLSKAEANGDQNDGQVIFSSLFTERSEQIDKIKVEAPEVVRPTGTRTIAESLAAMDETRNSVKGLRRLFEQYDVNLYKFPHPFFGDLSALEWLGLIGFHEERHIRQIKRIQSADAEQ